MRVRLCLAAAAIGALLLPTGFIESWADPGQGPGGITGLWSNVSADQGSVNAGIVVTGGGATIAPGGAAGGAAVVPNAPLAPLAPAVPSPTMVENLPNGKVLMSDGSIRGVGLVKGTPGPGTGTVAAPAAPPAPDVVAAWAAAATTNIDLPLPTPHIGPDPSVNKWNMVAVGFPIWMWTDTPRTLTTTADAAGHTLTLTATPSTTTFDMGDGTVLTCATMTPYVQGQTKPGAPSPDCGHRYLRKPAGGRATITATQTWTIGYSAAGQSGTFPVTRVATRTVDVGELESVVVG